MSSSPARKILLAGTALLLMNGCAGDKSPAALSAAASETGLKAAAKASKASAKAARKGDSETALAYAENAVLAAPQEAAYRARLGHAYRALGRFRSAEQAYAEARVLGDGSAKTLIGHALSLTAIGRTDRARMLLVEHRADLPASDYGLALALLGDSDHSVEVLVDAVRNAPPSLQTRQNLALAFALAGRWRESQLVAQRDLDPQALRERMVEWARIARPGAYAERVASILGVAPVEDDAGMPVMLALDAGPEDDVTAGAAEMVAPSRYGAAALATVAPATRPAAFTAGEPAAFPAEKDVRVAPVARAAAPVSAKPGMPGVASTTRSTADLGAPARGGEDRFIIEEERPAIASARPAAKVAPAATSGGPAASPWLVQMGAYSTDARATRAWSLHAKRHPALTGYASAMAVVDIHGRKLHRVAASGFESRADATAFCRSVKAKGGDCLVRSAANFRR